MSKKYVLDTNVLLHDPQALLKFEDNDVVIPITVIEEIDAFKKDLNEIGRNARHVSRMLDELRSQGSLTSGVDLESGGTLKVDLFSAEYAKNLPPELHAERADNRILAVAVAQKDNFDGKVVFVTKDTNLRIKANALGLIAQDYQNDKVSIEELYSGTLELTVPSTEVDRFYGQGFVELPDQDFYPNQCVTLIDAGNPTRAGWITLSPNGSHLPAPRIVR